VTKPRVIAFYLPQYYPTPENDAFWGAGFTEWTNVAAARPLFRGHDQPKIPGELGFYDLRLPETRRAQAELARAHGVEAFLYWHYWFGGRRVLDRPFAEVLEQGEPSLPFCLGWANQSWTGVWYGAPERVLIEQTYPEPADHEEHFEALLPAFRDPRYLRVDGRPLFLVYDPEDLPAPRDFASTWRKQSRSAGLGDLYLMGLGSRRWDPVASGFDAAARHGFWLPGLRRQLGGWRARLRGWRRRPVVYAYRDFVDRGFPEVVSDRDYPVALSNWDNSPRSGENGLVLQGGTPQLFRRHLREAIACVADRPPDRQIVFVKSWNEWAEGNYLEPDRRFGRAYLEAIRDEVAAWQHGAPAQPLPKASAKMAGPASSRTS
jgi:lipopolysaccharide biosynthesis protein